MSEELLKAIEEFSWDQKPQQKVWRLHHDERGRITDVGAEDQVDSSNPYIEVNEVIGKEFVSGARYKRQFYIQDGKLERRPVQPYGSEVSDTSLTKITSVDQVDEGTYFITVKGDPDLVIDTIVVNLSNKDIETQRIEEYLENNDCYKDA
jgi:hypothetical protein